MRIIYPCKSRRITSPFGPRSIGDKFHDGIDFGAIKAGAAGDEIYATHFGVIARAYKSSSYGNCVIINDASGEFSTLYAHLTKFTVSVGQRVKINQVIGYMGATGNATGVHLHFELRTQVYDGNYFVSSGGKFKTAVDPAQYFYEPSKIELNKELIKHECNFDEPEEIFKLLELHKDPDALFEKWANSYK